jgi:hypothetical protein
MQRFTDVTWTVQNGRLIEIKAEHFDWAEVPNGEIAEAHYAPPVEWLSRRTRRAAFGS